MADREKKAGKKGGQRAKQGRRDTGVERTEPERGREAQERGVSSEYGSEDRDLGREISRREGDKGGTIGGGERPAGEIPPLE